MASEDLQMDLDKSVETPNDSENLQQQDSVDSANLLQVSPLEREKKLWLCYSKRVKQLHDDMSNAEMFEKFNVYELQTKLTRLQKAMKELDDQDLQVKMFDEPNSVEHDQKHEEITALSDVFQAKILARIAELRNAERHYGISLKRQAAFVAQSTTGIAPGAEPVPKKQITWGTQETKL